MYRTERFCYLNCIVDLFSRDNLNLKYCANTDHIHQTRAMDDLLQNTQKVKGVFTNFHGKGILVKTESKVYISCA